MTGMEALAKFVFKHIQNDDGFNWLLDKKDKELLEIIQKDLEILEDFVKLFEGEDLEGWIEFNFGYTREPEDSIDNYNGFITLLKRIRNYLEGVKNENTSKEEIMHTQEEIGVAVRTEFPEKKWIK